MSIATRIEAIEQHLTDDYSVLELAGADLTNVDKNIENLKQSWEERLLYFLANGTDALWNNWLPKVTGTGENITLNNTIEAKMEFVYKGNTYQYSTTGKNLCYFSNFTEGGVNFNGSEINVGNTTGSVVYVGSNFNLQDDTSKSGKTYTIYVCVNGTKQTGSIGTGLSINFAKTGVPVAFQVSLASSEGSFNNRIYVGTITLGENEVFRNVSVVTNNAITANINVKVMIVEGSYTAQTIGDYEPYTNGASPNPDYPQDIQVVSGDNTIKVEGKNLFDGEFRQGSWNSTTSTDRVFSKNQLFLKRGTTCIFETDLDLTTYNFGILVNDSSFPVSSLSASLDSGWLSTNTYTFTTTRDGYFGLNIKKIDGSSINVSNIENSNFVLYNNSQSYNITLGNLELCKIGDYQDSIKKSTGKNLLDGELELGGYSGGTGAKQTANDNYRNKNIIEVKPNTTYTFSINGVSQKYVLFYYTSSQSFISSTTGLTTGTFTTPNNCYYINFRCFASDFTSDFANLKVQLEKGNQATPYEPYGKVWYLNKQIGKVVLDGSEDWRLEINATNYYEYKCFTGYNSSANISSHFDGTTNSRITIAYNYLYLRFPKSAGIDVSTVELFKTWLSNNNTTVYYVLATPTTTEITDTTLISQLEAIKKSYNTQTNISQTNADKPFILDVVALGELI